MLRTAAFAQPHQFKIGVLQDAVLSEILVVIVVNERISDVRFGDALRLKIADKRPIVLNGIVCSLLCPSPLSCFWRDAEELKTHCLPVSAAPVVIPGTRPIAVQFLKQIRDFDVTLATIKENRIVARVQFIDGIKLLLQAFLPLSRTYANLV